MKFSAAFVTLIAGTAASVVRREVRDIYNLSELESVISGSPKVATNFCASFSSICTIMKSKFEELSNKYRNVVFIRVDVVDAGPAMVRQKYNVTAIPTYITFKDGKEVGERVIGPLEEPLEEQVAALSKS